MSVIYEFTRRVSMAHRLTSGLSPKCSVPHGHNELITLRLKPVGEYVLDLTTNMPAAFDAMKKKWHQFLDDSIDHGFQLARGDAMYRDLRKTGVTGDWRMVVAAGDPTTEFLAAALLSKAEAILLQEAPHMKVLSVSVEETPTNKVTVHDRLGLPTGKEFWWNRPDLQTRDDM